MKNTIVTELILNAKLMSKDHFCDWLFENIDVLLEKEKQQILNASNHQKTHVELNGEPTYENGEKYFKGVYANYKL